MTKLFSVSGLGLTFAVVSTFAAVPAHAQFIDTPISVSVGYADLDINQAAGAKILLERIDAASVRACGGEPDIHMMQQRATFDQCRKSAVDQAVATVNTPLVTALADQGLPSVHVASR
jgi:UrcA family protein